MDSCTIIIPFVKEIEYLDGILRQIKKNEHPEVETHVLVVNQAQGALLLNSTGIIQSHGHTSINGPRIDAGYPIDFALPFVQDEFICSLDADAFPISNTWLYEPIQLIKKNNLSFVGKQTGLHQHPDYKAKSNFYHLNNYYRVSKTSVAKDVSLNVGFMRPGNRAKVNFNPILREKYALNCDNGVVGQMYSDDYELGNKFSYPITRVLGMTNELGLYGMVIGDKVFHMVFGYCEEYNLDKQKSLGEKYMEAADRIKEEGLTDDVIQWLMDSTYSIPDNYGYWDCVLKQETIISKEQYMNLL